MGRIRVPKDHRTFVRRDEFNQLIDTLNDRAEVINEPVKVSQRLSSDQHIQLQRIAQLQAELDPIKRRLRAAS